MIAVELMRVGKDLDKEKTPLQRLRRTLRAGGAMEDKAEAQSPQSGVAEGRPSVQGRESQCSREALPRLIGATH